MTILIYLLLLIFIVFLFYRFEETVVIIAVFLGVLEMLMINKNISLFEALTFVSVILGVLNYRSEKYLYRYPFLWVSFLVVLSMICTNLFGKTGTHWPSTIISITSGLLFPVVLWYCFLKKAWSLKRLFVYTSLLFLSFVSLYGFYELITDSNPIIEYAVKNKESFAGNIGFSERYRFGVRRLQSFLTYNSALGVTANLGVILIGYLRSIGWQNRTFLNAMLVLLTMMSLFTGTRSVFVGLFIAWAYYAFTMKVRLSYIISSIFSIVVLLLFFGQYFSTILNSFIESDSVGGSSADMREIQFSLAYSFMSSAGMFGNGVGFLSSYVKEFFRDEILGAESVWLPLMVNNGYIGVITYAVFIIASIVICVKQKCWAGLAVVLSFMTTKTLTSAPGIGNYYFLIYLLFYLTYHKFKSNASHKNDKMVLS